MQFTTSILCTIIATASLVHTFPLVSPLPLEKRANACASVELVFARGTGDPGIVGPPLYTALKKLVPDAVFYNIDYRAGVDFLTSAASGTAAMQKYVEARNQACPKMKFALGGYSQGVMVVHGLKLSDAAKNNVAAIAAFGDPYTLMGAAATWPINNPASNVYRVCNTGDPVCGGGVNVMAHLTYGANLGPAAQFIAQRVSGAATTSAVAGAAVTDAATPGVGGLLGGLNSLFGGQ
ncbi:cutinase-domain-containing protein [Pyronema omphalodes]|nr:cutinase-domain-containing protein [Pyronema omphalodes]